MKTWILIVICLIGTFVLSIFMMLLGMNVFGNFFVDATFLGARGYEAGGNLGFLLGILLGGSLSVFFIRTNILKHRDEAHHE